jgi:hypothetical protein
LFSNNRINALAFVGLLCVGPLDERPVLEGLAGRGYRAASGRPGLSESGGTGDTERAPNVLARFPVGVVMVLEAAESGSVRSLTTVSLSRPLSTDLTDRSRRGVERVLEDRSTGAPRLIGAVTAPEVESERDEMERGGERGTSSDNEGPEPSMSRVEKTLS